MIGELHIQDLNVWSSLNGVRYGAYLDVVDRWKGSDGRRYGIVRTSESLYRGQTARFISGWEDIEFVVLDVRGFGEYFVRFV